MYHYYVCVIASLGSLGAKISHSLWLDFPVGGFSIAYKVYSDYDTLYIPNRHSLHNYFTVSWTCKQQAMCTQIGKKGQDYRLGS